MPRRILGGIEGFLIKNIDPFCWESCSEAEAGFLKQSALWDDFLIVGFCLRGWPCTKSVSNQEIYALPAEDGHRGRASGKAAFTVIVGGLPQ